MHLLASSTRVLSVPLTVITRAVVSSVVPTQVNFTELDFRQLLLRSPAGGLHNTNNTSLRDAPDIGFEKTFNPHRVGRSPILK